MTYRTRIVIGLGALFFVYSAAAVQTVSLTGSTGEVHNGAQLSLTIPGTTEPAAEPVKDDDGDGIVVIDSPPGEDVQIQVVDDNNEVIDTPPVVAFPDRGDTTPPVLLDAFSIDQDDNRTLVTVWDELSPDGQYHIRVGKQVFSFSFDPRVPAGTGRLEGADELGLWEPYQFQAHVYNAETGEVEGQVGNPFGLPYFGAPGGLQPQAALSPGADAPDLEVAAGEAGERSWVALKLQFRDEPIGAQWAPYREGQGRSEVFTGDRWESFKIFGGDGSGNGDGMEVLAHILAGENVTGLPGPDDQNVGQALLENYTGPEVVINADHAFLLGGPSANEPAVDVVPGGAEFPVVGRSPDGQWYQVQLDGDKHGWVNGDVVLLRGNATQLPVVEAETDPVLSGTPEVAFAVGDPNAIPGLVQQFGLRLDDLITPLPGGGTLVSGSGDLPWDKLVEELEGSGQVDYATPNYCHQMYPSGSGSAVLDMLVPEASADGEPSSGIGPWDLTYDTGDDRLAVTQPHPVSGDARVRAAINRYSANDAALGAFPADPPVTGNLPWDDGPGTHPYDPDAAATLLEDAGWVDTDGDGVKQIVDRVGSDAVLEAEINWVNSVIDLPANQVLSLHGGRMKVEVDWRDAEGNAGTGTAIPSPGGTGGSFWFFSPDNLDLLVRVLDGCSFNSHYWVFYGALTNMDYTITVSDVESGAVKTYTNPLGQAAPPITDTEAFATCP